MYIYNATVHSLTGYSPYYLFFGREPILPIDLTLGLHKSTDDENLPVDDWIQEHRKKTSEASKLALSNTEKSARPRNQQKNKKTSESLIPIGTRVLTRNRIPGRNKIQDTWCSTPYKVVKYLGDNVYSIQLADGSGPIKNVTRKEILDTGEKVDSNDEYSSSDELNLEYIPEQTVQIQDEDEHSATAEDLQEDANRAREEPLLQAMRI